MLNSKPIRRLIARYRHSGLSGLRDIATDNLYRLERIVQWRVVLADWQPPTDAPAQPAVRRDARRALVEFRANWRGSPLPKAFYADQLHGLRRVWLGVWDGDVAHVSWISDHATSVRIRLKPGEVELRDVYTFASFRGRRVSRAVLNAILTDLKKEGTRTVVSYVGLANVKSHRMLASVGFQPGELVTSRRVLGCVSNRRIPWELTGRQRPDRAEPDS